MENIEISIIIPVYNTNKDFFEECMNSLLEQTIKDKIEIIIVDDGSKKEVANLCDEYLNKYENIVVIHQKNQGLGISRNNGMKKASGKWIMFVDSDDWIEKDMCEKLLKQDTNDVDIIMCSCNLCYKNKRIPIKMFESKKKIEGKEIEKLQLQNICKDYLKKEKYNANYFMVAWAKIYRRKFIINNNLDCVCNLRFTEDNIFNLYCLEYAKKIIYIDYNLYNYRQCFNSLIHRNDLQMEELYLKYLSEEKEFIIKRNKKEEFYDAHNLKCVQSIVKIIDKYILNQENNNIKVLEIMKIAKNTEIKEAIKNVKYKYLNLYLKIIIFLIKNKKYRIIVMLSKVRKFIKENKKFRKKVEFF